MAKPKKKDKSQWELEAPFDQPASLEELIEASPFSEAGGADSVTAGTRIPRWLFRRVAKLSESPGTPYDIVSDVYRDAIYIGLRIIHMRHKIAQDWSVDAKLASVVSGAGLITRIRSQVDELATALDNLVKEGERDRAVEELENYVSAAVELDDGWRKTRTFKMMRDSKVIMDIAKHCSKTTKKTIDEIGIKEDEQNAPE